MHQKKGGGFPLTNISLPNFVPRRYPLSPCNRSLNRPWVVAALP